MRLARQLIMSKRGLAIAEPGEIEVDEEAAIAKYKGAFVKPLRQTQICALSALAKGAGGRGARKQKVA
jgi:hypothetical protein